MYILKDPLFQCAFTSVQAFSLILCTPWSLLGLTPRVPWRGSLFLSSEICLFPVSGALLWYIEPAYLQVPSEDPGYNLASISAYTGNRVRKAQRSLPLGWCSHKTIGTILESWFKPCKILGTSSALLQPLTKASHHPGYTYTHATSTIFHTE